MSNKTKYKSWNNALMESALYLDTAEDLSGRAL